MPFLGAEPPLGPGTRKIDGKHKVHEQDACGTWPELNLSSWLSGFGYP
jgi:hypothetical protein